MLRITPPGIPIESYLLPLCYNHTFFIRDAMTKHAYMPRKKVAIWLQDNINPINSDRLMRFIEIASQNNAPILH